MNSKITRRSCKLSPVSGSCFLNVNLFLIFDQFKNENDYMYDNLLDEILLLLLIFRCISGWSFKIKLSSELDFLRQFYSWQVEF